MAGVCRSAVMAGTKSLASRSKALIPKTLSSKPLASPFSSSTRPMPCASRILSALGSVESLMPLHSAVASARLKSFIAVDSTSWSWLSQGFFPLLFKFYFLSYRRC
ncbi:protein NONRESPONDING TO OXYLIPINS 2, mitochondrial isoform X1 [Vitis vinifera]|uniref:protein NONRESPONDING TO OXYLIPINS 2, mitochondrial isoform X1 n=1 Tax=Vitis vinifera TaxID=29760 RepID=UPI0028831475|nr:protein NONRESPONDING TO OXYLIPINS 2, mitochondrial isoform X1 [Vitis vinifera]